MAIADNAETLTISRRKNMELVSAAVHRHGVLTRDGLTERLFILAFSSLVYPQIWEDPRVDIEALQLEEGHRLIAIASGGCNILSYLCVSPIQITAVDLNSSHVALNRLKAAAVRCLDYDEFARFFRDADDAENIAVFDKKLSRNLDAETHAYWSRRDWIGRRRIEVFARGFYRYGLLGRFIGFAHLFSKGLGVDPKALACAQSIEEQHAFFNAHLKPLFERTVVQKLLAKPSTLFGLGIPPAQFEALSEGRPMHEVIVERLEKLACGFPMADNYFAWQAFNRGYAKTDSASLPPYLQRENFESLKSRIDGANVLNSPLEGALQNTPARRLDRYVLLDAQDWMTDGQLNLLWREITRTARPGARVIFRTAGTRTILPDRVRQAILDQWVYRVEDSAKLSSRDRSAIYGGFHLYERIA